MAHFFEIHRNEELKGNLVPVGSLWPEVAGKLNITIKQAAEYVEKICVRHLIILYIENEYSGLWEPICEYTEEEDQKLAAQQKTKERLLMMWQICENNGWSDESITGMDGVRITHNEINEIWDQVEKICNPNPVHWKDKKPTVHHREKAASESVEPSKAETNSIDQNKRYKWRELAKPVPRARLIPVTDVIQAVSDLTDGAASIPEICDALYNRYGPEAMMLYRGIGEGLAEAIDGLEGDEYSGFNQRSDLESEFGNSLYWKNPGVKLHICGEEYDHYEVLMVKDDGLTLAQKLWEFFVPNRSFDFDRYQSLTNTKSAVTPMANAPGPLPNQSQNTGIDLPATATRWPWGNHHTELLGHLDAAARQFWTGYDPADAKRTAPKVEAVKEWLKAERKVTDNMAGAIATMLRPDGLPTGPRK